jgi:uncharacterized membrane protein YphA (DoxX/SURF4 family)
MLIALWIVNGILALCFLASGLMKLIRRKEKLSGAGTTWDEDFAQPVVKLIGLAEVLGAIGLVLPLLTGIAPILTPIAAVGLAVIMLGATITHIRRKENPAVTGVLGLLAIGSAVAGFLVVLG